MFRGSARITRNPATLTSRITGGGSDTRGRSAARGAVSYQVLPGAAPGTSIVDIEVGYALSGVLAQFGRPGLVKDLAGRLAAAFAENLEARLSGTAVAPEGAGPLDAAGLLLGLLRARMASLFAWLSGTER